MYDREGEPCVRRGAPIVKMEHTSRKVFFVRTVSMKSKVRIGSHVSTRGGFLAADPACGRDRFTSLSVFSEKSAQSSLKDAGRPQCRRLLRVLSGTRTRFDRAHPISDEYGGWLNPGEAFYQLTVDSLKNDLMIAEACGSLGIVVHFGHLKSQDILEGYQNIIRRMNDVLSSWTGRAKLLIENQAGIMDQWG